MARSIRYWCSAFGLIEDVPLPKKRITGWVQTQFGKRLLGKNGLDEYLENPASLWLLHWKLVQSPSLATAWYHAFTVFTDLDFSVESLADSLERYCALQYPTARIAPSAFEKDASCIARMYGGTAPLSGMTEDSIQSPFTELGLLFRSGLLESRSPRYRFETGVKRSLPAAIVAVACLEYAARVTPGVRTVSVSRLISEPGSPGMAFKLNTGALVNYLEEACGAIKGLSLTDAAGLRQFTFGSRVDEHIDLLLRSVYRTHRRQIAA